MRIVYEAPPCEVIEEYVRQACQRLAEERDPAYAKPEVMQGFADFLQVVAAIWAKHLNTLCEAEDNVDIQAA